MYFLCIEHTNSSAGYKCENMLNIKKQTSTSQPLEGSMLCDVCSTSVGTLKDVNQVDIESLSLPCSPVFLYSPVCRLLAARSPRLIYIQKAASWGSAFRDACQGYAGSQSR